MFQFIKAKSGNWGESRAARKMGVEIVPLGSGFTWTSTDLERDRALAHEGWERCRAAIESGDYDVVVLDELTYCFTFGWLDLEEVLAVLRRRPAGQHVVITGRDAAPGADRLRRSGHRDARDQASLRRRDQGPERDRVLNRSAAEEDLPVDRGEHSPVGSGRDGARQSGGSGSWSNRRDRWGDSRR